MRFNIQNENNTYKKISIVSKNSLGRISIPGPGLYNPTLTLNQVDGRDVLNVCLAPSQLMSLAGASNGLDLSMSGNFPELSITVNDVTRVFADTGSPSDDLENGGV